MLKDRKGKGRLKRKRENDCCCCKKTFSFCWRCPCGFSICQDCMQENLWGMTCNNIYWTCPDCGAVRQY